MILEAVAKVFLYKQSNWMYANAQVGDDGEPVPFDLKQLYDVVRQLHPTQEIALFAWTMSLELNIGTSMMGINAMTVLADTFDFRFSDLLREAVDENGHYDPLVAPEGEFFKFFQNRNPADRSNEPRDAELAREARRRAPAHSARACAAYRSPRSELSNRRWMI